MRVAAACLVEPGKIEVRDRELQMTDEALLVRILGNGICGTDVAYFAGRVPGLHYPRFIGHEAVGIIEEAGRAVRGYAAGDLVTGSWGGYSNYTVVTDLGQTMKVPHRLNVPREYALGDPLQCIVTIARAARPEAGDNVAVVGCGFMGLMCIALLKAASLRNLIAVDCIEGRLALAKECQCTLMVNPDEEDAVRAVLSATGGRGVDICIEAAGSPSAVELGAALLKKGRGRLVLGGLHPQPATYNLLPWAVKGLEVINAHPSYSLDVMEDMRRGIAALGRGVFPMEKLITHRFELQEVQQVFEQALERKSGYVKGVMVT